MTSPSGNVTPQIQALEDEVRQIRAELSALGARSLRDAGTFSTKTPAGVTTFFTGPNYVALKPDGSPQWITTIRDESGQSRIAFWDPNPLSDGYVQVEWHYDHTGQIVWTTDINGGWAEPWLPVVLYPLVGSGTFGGVFGYLNTPVNGTEQMLWQGEIGYVSHPRISVTGIWGQASGAGQTTRYRLKVGGVTVGTWDVAGISADNRGPFDIASRVNDKQVQIELTGQTLAGTGNYACQVLGCHLRQT